MDNKSYLRAAMQMRDGGRHFAAVNESLQAFVKCEHMINQMLSYTAAEDAPILVAAMELTCAALRQEFGPQNQKLVDLLKENVGAVAVDVTEVKEGGSA